MNIPTICRPLLSSSAMSRLHASGSQAVASFRHNIPAHLAPVPGRIHPSRLRSPLKDVNTQQVRAKFTVVSPEEFQARTEELKVQGKTPELVGYHGTTRWAADEMARVGVDPTLTGKYHRTLENLGKYLGDCSAAHTGLYCVDNKAIADYYARRAGVGEQLAFDLDTRKTILSVYRVPTGALKTAAMPQEIIGKPKAVREFREKNRVDEIRLEGSTPAPARFAAAGIEGRTTLITEEGLTSETVEYLAVRPATTHTEDR